MTDIITVFSSDEEEIDEPPKKKIKPTTIGEVTIIALKPEDVARKRKKTFDSQDVVVVSDDDENFTDADKNSSSVPVQNGKEIISLQSSLNKDDDDDDDSVTCIDDDEITSKEKSISENETKIKETESTDLQKHSGGKDVDGNEENSDQTENNENKGNTDLIIQGEENEDVENNCIQKNEDENCGVVIIEENNLGASPGKENNINSTSVSSDLMKNLIEASTSSRTPLHNVELETFLNTCSESLRDTPYEDIKTTKFPVLVRLFKKCGPKLRESADFKKLLEINTKRARESVADGLRSFKEVFQHIKDVVNIESVEVTKEHRIKLKKLEKALTQLVSKIKQLEDSEIDFDDEEDSTYLQLDRYTNRLNKVYSKYCEILKQNPHSGRLTYSKLDFVDSDYNEINIAINKKYKNNKQFPSYIEMENFIKKVATENALNLSENKLKTESEHCFKKLGTLLQDRRKRELYETHYIYIRDNVDPANQDPVLDTTLRESFDEGQNKIERLCEQYVSRGSNEEEVQKAEEQSSEEDSDNSGYVDSENEGEIEENPAG